jgi:hypothetical protein
VWPRRHGKDLTALHQLAVMAHDRVGMYWHGLPTYEQARKSCWTAFRTDTGQRLMDNVFPREVVRRPAEWAPSAEMLVELRNGSLIQFVGSDSIDHIVGAGPLGVNCSEFALWKPSAFDLISPMLEEAGGWASFLFTPRGHNHAWRLYEAARKMPGWHVSKRTILDAGKYSPEAAAKLLAREAARGMLPELVRQEYFTDFAASMVGSYWGDALEKMERRGALAGFEADLDLVFVCCDLGINDQFSMWAYRPRPGGGADWLAHYASNSQPISHYLDKMVEWRDAYGFSYAGAKLWLPHDGRARTLVTGESIAEVTVREVRARELRCQVDIVPDIGKLNGIQAARAHLLDRQTRIHPRCSECDGVEALRQYHREYDEDARVFRNVPEHDWSSNPADAFRYGCVAMQLSKNVAQARRPRAQVVRPAAARESGIYAPPLDDRAGGRGRR